jgi:hypothetical protein
MGISLDDLKGSQKFHGHGWIFILMYMCLSFVTKKDLTMIIALSTVGPFITTSYSLEIVDID